VQNFNKNKTTFFRSFLFHTAIPMSNIERDLYRACHGNLQEVKRLLAAGADVNAEYHGWPPLFVASEKNRLDVVRLLLDNGANVEGTADGGYIIR
jgi:ankyrin repeat protein